MGVVSIRTTRTMGMMSSLRAMGMNRMMRVRVFSFLDDWFNALRLVAVSSNSIVIDKDSRSRKRFSISLLLGEFIVIRIVMITIYNSCSEQLA